MCGLEVGEPVLVQALEHPPPHDLEGHAEQGADERRARRIRKAT
jgi:hypothetical protein